MAKRRSRVKGPIQVWGEKVNWERRVKAVCKPCWEIKYCPYGPLVELFLVKEMSDDKSCRIFGHDCPVFYTAEPLTETKELRNIGRSIPRTVQFRVLKRDNQICTECGKPVLDQDVEFDHIIPWSKGGASEEHNVKLLCRSCNRKKGSKFEDRYLVKELSDHLRQPVPFEYIEAIFHIMQFIWEVHNLNTKPLTPKDFCRLFGRRKVTEEDVLGAGTFNDVRTFFSSPRPKELKAKEFEALRYRWGFCDRKFHTIKDTSAVHRLDPGAVALLDRHFIERLGFHPEATEAQMQKWIKR